jgi:hypothetical protein
MAVMPLIACPECACHVRLNEVDCPHCGARVRRHDGGVARTAASALLGLTAIPLAVLAGSGCSSEDDDNASAYGSPSTGDYSGSSSSAQGSTGSGAAGGDGGEGGDGRGGQGGSAGAGGNGQGGHGGSAGGAGGAAGGG